MRLVLAAFAVLLLLPIYVAVDALKGAHRSSLFELRGITISKAQEPVAYRIYFLLFLLVIPFFAALALGLAVVAYVDPWGN